MSLGTIARVFLGLGLVSFGGPAAHIALMEQQLVRRRRWLSHARFLDYLGATNLIPGPNSTELAIHIGHARGGWPGLIVAGACFILPAAFIVLGVAWAYVRFGALPAATGLLYGVKPVVIAIVAQALWLLGRTVLRSRTVSVVGALALVATALGVHELVILAVAGGIMGLGRAFATRRNDARIAGLAPPIGRAVLTGTAAVALPAPFALGPLFAVFLKAGSLLFGSGYVLLAFLRADLVERLGWLTERQLLDAIAVGQFTPGPVFTTATFIGYLLGRGPGAAVATIGIFLPAFVFVAISGPLVPRLRRSPIAGAVLDGVNVASLALMAVVTWQLARAALVDPLTIVIAVASALLLWRLRLNAAWLVLGGGVVGWLVAIVGHA